MAERAAHLAPVTQFRPSLFDYCASESLDGLLYPSFHRISKFLAAKNIISNTAAESFDKYFYLGYTVLQCFHLTKFGATFSEKLYGLRRVPLNIRTSKSPLIMSLATVALIPYIKLKLSKWIEILSTEDDTSGLTEAQKRTITNINNWINILLKGVEVFQFIKFLSGMSNTISPWHWLSGVQLTYQWDEENTNFNLSLRSVIKNIIPTILQLGAFFLQFQQAFEAESKTVLRSSSSVDPPPLKENKNEGNKCPICGQKRYIETVLSTSGYVFCFMCISSYLLKHKECPITKLPSTVDNLIHIYTRA